jgi:hypothetical protein
MGEKEKIQRQSNKDQTNECPKNDNDGNCLVPGVYSDSDEIGGG